VGGPRIRDVSWPLALGLDTSRFDKNAPTQAPKPTIILVHDAFHTAEHVDQLSTELRQACFRVGTPQLPSSAWAHRANVFEADVRAIFEAGRTEIEVSRNVVLVTNGYSSLPSPSQLTGSTNSRLTGHGPAK